MLGIQALLERRKLYKTLRALLAEMEKNLEAFYVMDQRQFITGGFETAAWARVQGMDIVAKQEAIQMYAAAINKFNALFQEYKAYEQWYASDMKNKTQDNAKKLHGLKHELDTRLKDMEGIIIPAGQALEKEMLTLGMLKNA